MTFDYEQVDPGIRDVVRTLRDAGFDTTDSGDGSKAATMSCAVPWPMVAAVVDDVDTLLSESRRMRLVLGERWIVTASWDGHAPGLLLAEDRQALEAYEREANKAPE